MGKHRSRCRYAKAAHFLPVCIFCLGTLPAFFAGAEEADPVFAFEVSGLRTYTVLGFLPLPAGGDIALSYTSGIVSPMHPTELRVETGAGYEADQTYRNADGSPYTGAYDEGEISLDTVDGYVSPVVVQRLSSRLPLHLKIGLRTQLKWNFETDTGRARVFSDESVFPEAAGIASNSIVAGIRYDSVEIRRSHRDVSGFFAAASAEWAPGFLANDLFGLSDYLRLDVTGRFYLPLYDVSPEAPRNIFNIYLAAQIIIDALTGTYVPLPAGKSTGGFHRYDALGGLIRGFERKSKDTLFKAAGNLELRAVGPAIGVDSLVPVLTLFVDSGYYATYFNDPLDTPPGALVSAGAMLSLNIFDLSYLGYMIALPIVGSRVDGSVVAHGLAVGLHF